MLIFSLDPGIKNIGLSILDVNVNKKELKILNTFTLIAKDKSFNNKLITVNKYLPDYLNKHKPDIMVYEEPCFIGMGKTGSTIHEMLGVIKLKFLEFGGDEIYSYAPASIKKIVTGKGTAGKDDVERGLRKYFINGKYHQFDSNHSADATAIGLTYLIDKKIIKGIEND